jgi:hypothetical protein
MTAAIQALIYNDASFCYKRRGSSKFNIQNPLLFLIQKYIHNNVTISTHLRALINKETVVLALLAFR